MNRVTLMGQMIEAPEMRLAGQKPVANFVLETTESWMGRDGEQRRVIRHNCTAFGPIAKTIGSVRVGEYVYVEGALRSDDDESPAYEVVCLAAIPVVEPARAGEYPVPA